MNLPPRNPAPPGPVPGWALALTASPLLAAASYMAVVASSGLAGVGPFRPTPPATLSEAALATEVLPLLHRIRMGEDPNAPYPIPAHLAPSDDKTHLRPLEAAALSGDSLTVEVLLREGGSLPPGDRQRVACQARASGRHEVAQLLAGTDADLDLCHAPHEE
ncbi:MAG: hypothetical protein FJW23_16005 [Acidimicrobiia bacterium]|nr:hypothetical protein [Acidimicrobiia bacterium]